MELNTRNTLTATNYYNTSAYLRVSIVAVLFPFICVFSSHFFFTLCSSLLPTNSSSSRNSDQSSQMWRVPICAPDYGPWLLLLSQEYVIQPFVFPCRGALRRRFTLIFLRFLTFKELHTSLENLLSPTSNCIPTDNLMVQVYSYVIFRNKIGLPTIWGEGPPSFGKRFSGKVLERVCRLASKLRRKNAPIVYLYTRTDYCRRWAPSLFFPVTP